MALVFGALSTLVGLPFLPLVIVLRNRGVLPWTINAVTRPWGRKGPPTILRYHVRGPAAVVERAMDELVRKLELGDGAPVVAGAERIT
jgi:hypothetical protein